jgi:hypothetical protein
LIPIEAAAGVLAVEAYLHDYLSDRADRFYPTDPKGRKKHCYVNCMSTRIHGFNPVWPILASLEQEVTGLIRGMFKGTFKETAKDSAGDLAADMYGQQVSFVIWRWCQDLCENCPF